MVEQLSAEQLVARGIAPIKREFWRAEEEARPTEHEQPKTAAAPEKSRRKQRQVCI